MCKMSLQHMSTISQIMYTTIENHTNTIANQHLIHIKQHKMIYGSIRVHNMDHMGLDGWSELKTTTWKRQTTSSVIATCFGGYVRGITRQPCRTYQRLQRRTLWCGTSFVSCACPRCFFHGAGRSRAGTCSREGRRVWISSPHPPTRESQCVKE